MPSFELNRLQAVTGAKPLSSTDRMTQGPAEGNRTAVSDAPGAKAAAGGVSIAIGSALQASEISGAKAPVDSDRVAMIRDALRDGTYPLVPTQIADAMIAAQMNFEIER